MKWSRVLVTTVGQLATAGGTLFFALGKPTENTLSAVAGTACVVLAVVMVIIGLVQARHGQSEADQIVEMIDSRVSSIAGTFKTMVQATPRTRADNVEAMQEKVLDGLVTIVEKQTSRPRASLFIFNPDTQRAEPISTGRPEKPRPFVAGSANDESGRGDEALEYMRTGHPEVWPNLDKKKPEGWAGTGADYKGFACATLSVGDGRYGMVTLDVPAKKALTSQHKHLTSLFASLAELATVIGESK